MLTKSRKIKCQPKALNTDFLPTERGGHTREYWPLILIGVTDTNCSLFNYLIVLGKLHLWNCRRNNSLPFFPSYKELVKRKYETECHIAAKFNDRKMLEAKWKPILNYNLIDT